jgi:hypothetical protein
MPGSKSKAAQKRLISKQAKLTVQKLSVWLFFLRLRVPRGIDSGLATNYVFVIECPIPFIYIADWWIVD